MNIAIKQIAQYSESNDVFGFPVHIIVIFRL